MNWLEDCGEGQMEMILNQSLIKPNKVNSTWSAHQRAPIIWCSILQFDHVRPKSDRWKVNINSCWSSANGRKWLSTIPNGCKRKTPLNHLIRRCGWIHLIELNLSDSIRQARLGSNHLAPIAVHVHVLFIWRSLVGCQNNWKCRILNRVKLHE